MHWLNLALSAKWWWSSRQILIARVNGSLFRRSRASVSGKVSSATNVATPIPTSVQKITRQEARLRICPPAIGPKRGAIVAD
jgi:hypothetical protein